ncbi:MAG: ATP-binding protein [Deltaproteobacteria bacterium]|nr:ATP-binding protein [Deltaproteobacteria bacterium]
MENSAHGAPRYHMADCLEREISWFCAVLDARIQMYFEHENAPDSIHRCPPPAMRDFSSPYAHVVSSLNLGFNDRIAVILALLPHIRPQVLDTFFIKNKNFDRGFTEFGGILGKNHGGFLPTGETLAFILAGDDLLARASVLTLFEDQHPLMREHIISLDDHAAGEPFLSGALRVTTEYLSRFIKGVSHRPSFGIDFPAKRLTTPLAFEDLVLDADAIEEVEHISTWLACTDVIMNDWGLKKTIKPGYRALFYGPPGTGKTLTATLLGARFNMDVYRIDLASVVSKYIGETEKNLAGVFDQAENRNWILFFDEADALFGKRTQTASSNDRHANQEVSYLLQRVEDFKGTVILATNLKSNIDEAFARRFQSMVYFPMPDAGQRLRLWQSIVGEQCSVDKDVDFWCLAEKYELSGGAITNVVRYGAIRALRHGRGAITTADFTAGITRELRKEGKTV